MHNRLAYRLLLGLPVLPLACGGAIVLPLEATDTIPPGIESLSPPPRDSGVDLRAVIQVTFSKPVNPATIAAASFYVRTNLTPDHLALTLSYANRTLTATPAQPFDSLTVYLATMTRAVRDSTGNQLAADTTWEFRTRGGPVAAEAPSRLRTRS
jgi:hypothetical protein